MLNIKGGFKFEARKGAASILRMLPRANERRRRYLRTIIAKYFPIFFRPYKNGNMSSPNSSRVVETCRCNAMQCRSTGSKRSFRLGDISGPSYPRKTASVSLRQKLENSKLPLLKFFMQCNVDQKHDIPCKGVRRCLWAVRAPLRFGAPLRWPIYILSLELLSSRAKRKQIKRNRIT